MANNGPIGRWLEHLAAQRGQTQVAQPILRPAKLAGEAQDARNAARWERDAANEAGGRQIAGFEKPFRDLRDLDINYNSVLGVDQRARENYEQGKRARELQVADGGDSALGRMLMAGQQPAPPNAANVLARMLQGRR